MNTAAARPGLPLWQKIVAVVVAVSGLILAVAGAYLLSLGGTWYYLVNGVLMLVSGILLFAGRLWGAKLYGVVFLLALVMTLVESATRLWGWVPRMGYITLLGFFVALMVPRLSAGRLRRHGYLAAAGCVVFAAIAFALVFRTQYVEHGDDAPQTPLVAGDSAKARAAQSDGEWAAYGRDTDATRYSPAAQITPENVGKLKVAWTYHTGDLPPAGKTNKWGAQNTPQMIGGGLYVCSATNNVSKLDPATGKEIWKFVSGVKYENVPYTAACRGVTYFVSSAVPEGQSCHARIIVATLDMRLIELDAASGQPCAQFGSDGTVNLLTGMGKSVPGQLAVTSPPVVVNGTISLNHQVLDNQRRWAPSGVIRGYDAETGAFKWAWDVNHPGTVWHQEPGPGQEYSRGTPNSWGAMAGDNALNLIYVPTGNSAADYYDQLRTPAENAVASSIVALDATTGEQKWVFQTVHKDTWDYDIGSQPTLLDFPDHSGTPVPAMIIPTKRGQLFVVDRRNGKPLLPVEERPADTKATVPGESRASTQPWSTGMPRLGMPDLKESTMWGMTPFDQLYCRVKFRQAHYTGEFTAPQLKQPWIVFPGYNGGSDWGSVAYDPARGILVANWNVTPMYEHYIPRKQADAQDLYSIDDPRYKPGKGGAEGPGAMEDTPYAISVSAFMVPGLKTLCNEPPYGMITAINLHDQKVIWQQPLGTARANGPLGLPTGLPIQIGTPNNGGPAITAGGLVFVAAATDNLLRAIDLKTGKVLWTSVLPGGGQATPMTYTVNGKQYVVQMAGGHHFMETPISDALVAYSLP